MKKVLLFFTLLISFASAFSQQAAFDYLQVYRRFKLANREVRGISIDSVFTATLYDNDSLVTKKAIHDFVVNHMGATAQRFAIEDSASTVNRDINMHQHSLEVHDLSYFNIDAFDNPLTYRSYVYGDNSGLNFNADATGIGSSYILLEPLSREAVMTVNYSGAATGQISTNSFLIQPNDLQNTIARFTAAKVGRPSSDLKVPYVEGQHFMSVTATINGGSKFYADTSGNIDLGTITSGGGGSYHLPYNGNAGYYLSGDSTLHVLPTAIDTTPLHNQIIANTAAIATKEPIITAGTTSQYWRGDKTWQTFPTIPAQFNPIAGTNLTLSGTYPNITFNATSAGSVTSVTGTSPIIVTGTTTPIISFDSSLHHTKPYNDGIYQPLENQRLSTTNNVIFNTTNLSTQGSVPSSPSSGLTLYADATNRLSWVKADGFTRTLRFPYAGNTVLTGESKAAYTIADSADLANVNGNKWDINGNSLTAGVNFLGSTNNTSIHFKTNNTERAVLDSTGNFGLGDFGSGGQRPATHLHIVENGSTLTRGATIEQNSANNNASGLTVRKTRGTYASKTTVANGDYLGSIVFNGYDGSNYLNTVFVGSKISGTVATGSVPTDLYIATSPTGGVDPYYADSTIKMVVKSDGKVGIGNMLVNPTQRVEIGGQLKVDTLKTGSGSDSVVTVSGGVLGKVSQASITGGGASSVTEFKERYTSSTSTTKTLSHTPLFASAVMVFANGVLQDTPQYSLTGTTLTLTFTPVATDVITVKYSY